MTGRRCRVVVFIAALVATGGAAAAQMAEESLRHATDTGGTHLFPLSPSVLKPDGTRGGGLVTQVKREASLDHRDGGGEKVTSETTDEGLVAAAVVDLGAGAGLGLSHQVLFRKTETSLTSDSSRQPAREELAKIQHSALRLIVELTSELRAGVAVRYLYKDLSVLGDPFLSRSEQTRYKTTLIGYGAGLTYSVKNAGVTYTYYPPLRGKTEVYGEELIVVERGLISLDAYVASQGPWAFGVLAQKWVNEVDDLAQGTTSEDNQTPISLYGLDPDQYLFPKQLIMVGADYEVSKGAKVRVSLGQEQATMNFDDLLVYNRADVRGRGKEPSLKYNRIRAAVRIHLKGGLAADAGLGVYERQVDFPDSMNGGSYGGEAKELFATLGIAL